MSVLARELEAYQSAVDAYRRQLRGYNTSVDQYNASILKDADGNPMVRDANGTVYYVGPDGRLGIRALPADKIAGDYGASAIEGNSNYFLLRQNPIERKQQTISGVQGFYDSEQGRMMYYYYPTDGSYSDANPPRTEVNQNLYRLVSTQPGYDQGGDSGYSAPTYTFGTDASTYLDKPGEFTKQLMKAPDPTLTQLRKLQQPTAVEQERGGLISNEIIGRGNNPYL